MQYFSKNISKIFLIDIFTEQERQNPLFQVTKKLENYLLEIEANVTTFFPKTPTEVLLILQNISLATDLGEGIIIHFLSHGDSNGVGFGSKGCYIRWGDVEPHLLAINRACQGGLIMNTTCMCYGHNVFQLARPGSTPFHAAVGSVTDRTLQAWMHNKEVYKKCLLGDYAGMWWSTVNNNISYNSDIRKSYEYRIFR